MIKKIGNFRYSRKPFNGHKFRAKIEVKLESSQQRHAIDVYTDNESKDDTFDAIADNNPNIIKSSSSVVYWCSKEQDLKTYEFIEQFLNGDYES